MENEKAILNDAKSAAIRVEFLTTKEEFSLYAGAIYSAIMWGTGEGKSQFQERKKYLK